MKTDELWITIISGATGLALILYMVLQKKPAISPAVSPVYPSVNYPAFYGAASPALAQAQASYPQTNIINFSPLKLPSLKIPSSNLTIQMGSALFPLFGYAAGGGGGSSASGTLANLAAKYAATNSAPTPSANNGQSNYAAYRQIWAMESAMGITIAPYNPTTNYITMLATGA